MTSRKKTTTETTKERASVSRERRLALALKALLESLEDAAIDGPAGESVTEAELTATATLKELGYADITGIPRQLAALESQLAAATEAKDYALVAKLGTELERVRAGKAARAVEAPSE